MDPNEESDKVNGADNSWTTDDNNATRQNFFYHTSKMICELPVNKDVRFTRAFLASASQVLMDEALRMAHDAEQFAAHAQRPKVNMADIRLLFRNHPAFQAEIDLKHQMYKQQKRLITAEEEAEGAAAENTIVDTKKPRKHKPKNNRVSETAVDAEPDIIVEQVEPSSDKNPKKDSKRKKSTRKRKSPEHAGEIDDVPAEDGEKASKKRKRRNKSPVRDESVGDNASVSGDKILEKTPKKRKTSRTKAAKTDEDGMACKSKPAKKSKSSKSTVESKAVPEADKQPAKTSSKQRIKLPFNLLGDNTDVHSVPNAADRSFDSPTFSQLGLSESSKRKSTRTSRKTSPTFSNLLFSQSIDPHDASSDGESVGISKTVKTADDRTDYDKLMEGIDD